VDTTGAGVCFCGAHAQALARGEDLAAAVRYAVAAAALSTTGLGAREALPDDAAVRTLLPAVPDAAFLREPTGHRTAMTDPAQPSHTSEPAEGAPDPGEDTGGQTPHSEEPAEGADEGEPS
jgi:ribokinase